MRPRSRKAAAEPYLYKAYEKIADGIITYGVKVFGLADLRKRSALMGDVDEQVKGRQESLAGVIAAHEAWLSSGGQEGARADLTGEDLSSLDFGDAGLDRAILDDAILRNARLTRASFDGANLRGADFSNARMRYANLRNADLQNTNFSGADLRAANFSNSELQGANLESANLDEANFSDSNLKGAEFSQGSLRGTVFTNADLQDADLRTARGLTPDHLGGTNLSHAALPDGISGFANLDLLVRELRTGSYVWWLSLLLASIALAMVSTVSDVAIVTNETLQLPVLGIRAPANILFLGVSLILFGLYFVVHRYLAVARAELAKAPAVLPDGVSLYRRVPAPWTGILESADFDGSRAIPEDWSRRSWLWLLWGVVPLALAAIWLRYLPKQDWFYTGAYLLILFFAVAAALARRERAMRILGRKSVVGRILTYVVAGIIAAMGGVSWLAIEGPRTEIPGIPTYAYANLERAVLLNADLSGVNLRRANLREARLDGADVSVADLGGADLSGASLVRANLRQANLREAFLGGADLSGADLNGADLNGANLRQANLIETSLGGADLRDTSLVGADLSGADLAGARLLGADLSDANLLDLRGYPRDLQSACGNERTSLPKELKVRRCENIKEQ